MPSIRKLMRTVLVLVCAQAAIFAGAALADPPTRVARLAYVQGPVSFTPAGEDEWVVATPNRPLIAGDRIWSDAAARTEFQVGSAVLRFGASTSATVLNLDDQIAQFEVTEGSVQVNARRLAPNEVVEIDTPNLALTIRKPGTYRIEVDTNGDSTAVSVRRGEAEVYGEGAAYVIPSGQFYRFYATGLQQRQYAAVPAPDEFDQWAATRDQQYDASATARYVAPEVIGYQDLDQYGTWSSVPEYGNVWTPNRVAADWAPYRDGRWSWIEPWGWTWVDAEPWGFAPYHYGRWAYASDRWCWVPGPRTARPVYGPAFVAFVGDGNLSVSISAGSSAPIGWFPLAPGEVYRPAYRVSRDYFTRVNVANTVVNTTIVNNYYNNSNVANVAYRNRQAPRAITAVPADVFAQSRPVRAAAVQVATVDMSKLQVAMAPPVAPTRASVLAAPAAAHRPADQVTRREVVARTKPAPTPAPFQAREQALAKQAGRPLDPSAVASGTPAAKADERRVRLVTESRRPEPAPKTSQGVPGNGQAPVATQGTVPVPGLPNRQEAGKTREDAQQAARQQQEQQRAQQQEQQKSQQATRQQDQQRAQQQEQQKAQQAARQQQDQQRAQQQEQQKAQQAARQQQDQQRAQQQEQQKAQQAARQQQQEQQKAQQAARQQQQDQQRVQQQEQQKSQQAARQQQQQEQQRAQQAARQQQQQEQQKAQQAQQAARQQQQQEQQRAQQAQQAARQQQQEQQKAQQAQQAARQQQQQEQQRAQQAARQQQQQEQQRAQQERARQAPPAAKGKDKERDEDKQAKGG